jgi:hypothetical protein
VVSEVIFSKAIGDAYEEGVRDGKTATRALIQRAGLRISFCGYCGEVCLAGKRSLCCGDAVYDDDPATAGWTS